MLGHRPLRSLSPTVRPVRRYATGRPWLTATTSPPRRSGLADLEPRECGDGDAGLLEHLRHGLLGVRDGRLLDQYEVLEERVHPALDDLRQGRLGLALLASGLLGDAALGLDDLGGHLVAGDVLRAHRSDLHRDTASVVDAGLVLLAGVLHGDAD